MMKKKFSSKKYNKKIIRYIIALIVLVIVAAVVACFSKIKDERLLLIFIPTFIIELCLIIFMFRTRSLKNKEMVKFIYNESTLKHFVPEITIEQVLKRLKEKSFETYSVDDMHLGLQLVNIKTKIFEMSLCHAFLILDKNILDEKVFMKNGQLDIITNNYLKGKKIYNHSYLSPVICFWGEHLSEEAIKKCQQGLDMRQPWIYIGYETSSKTVYYADAIGQLDMRGIYNSLNIKDQWIKEIFQINDSIDFIY